MTNRIVTHWDADGITSGYFTSFAYPEYELTIGDYSKGFGSTEGLTKEDIMCDMRPSDPKWNGTCIDHHFPHSSDRKYKLIPDIDNKLYHYASDIIPATYIAWETFKDKIPKSEWWKICIGLGGDGALDLTPPEVFEECPMLLTPIKTSAYQSYGNWKINTYPLYSLLSSCMNSFLRKYDYESAIYAMKFCQSPMELYSLPDVQIAKREVKSDYETCIKDAEIYEFGGLVIVIFSSKFRMSGYVSSSLSSTFNGKTIMAINEKTGSVSLRGTLSPYYKHKLKDLDYLTLDGHNMYMGGKLHKNPSVLINDLSALL